MKAKRLIFTPLIVFASILAVGLAVMVVMIVVLIIVTLLGGTVNWFPQWLLSMLPPPAQTKDFVTSLGVLFGILAAILGAVATFIKFAWGQSGWNTINERNDESPLRQITLDELRELPGKQGGRVNWIDRGATKLGDLRIHNRIVITGRMKLGKTREAVELIRRAVADEQVNADRIFEPSSSFRLSNREKLLDVLKGMDPHLPILLFLDDFHFHYTGESLERLSDLLSVLRICKTVLIVATARTDQLTSEHYDWLKNQKYHEIRLPDLNYEQTAQLLDTATGIFGLQIDNPVRTAFLDNRDGTPELTIMALRRLYIQKVSRVTVEIANKVAVESLADSSAEARRYIFEKHPTAEYIFDALSAFHAARVTPFTPFVLDYASHLWAKRKPWSTMRRSTLQHTLRYLENFDIIVRNDMIVAPDVILEGYILKDVAIQVLGAFLLTHRRLFQNRFLQHLYPQATLHASCLFDLGVTVYETRDFRYAINLFTAALCFNVHSYVYNNRGVCYFKLNDHTAALADYAKAIELWPHNAPAYNNCGNSHYALKDYAAALADYTKSIKFEPDDALTYNNRGNSYHALKDYPAALADYTKAIKLLSDGTEKAKAYKNRSHTYNALKDYHAALADCAKAIELIPNYAEAYNSRATSYIALQNYPAVLADYAKAIELQPDYATAYFNRGTFLYNNLQDYSAALSDYSKAIELEPNNPLAYYNRAISYTNLKDYSAAQANYIKTVELSPDFHSPYYNIACLYALQSQAALACTWLRRSIMLAIEDLGMAKTDRDFDTIRDTPEFQALMSEFAGD